VRSGRRAVHRGSRVGRPGRNAIDILYGIERMEMLLDDPDILATRVASHAEVNRNVGIGVAEAPRGAGRDHGPGYAGPRSLCVSAARR
jgi:hypothetical protein